MQMYLGDIYTVSGQYRRVCRAWSCPAGFDGGGAAGRRAADRARVRRAAALPTPAMRLSGANGVAPRRARRRIGVMATYEMVIGLEVHVELATKTQDFLRLHHEIRRRAQHAYLPGLHGHARNAAGGSTKRSCEFAVAAGLATNCEITRYNKFDRKNYFYPDLPKAYQISQLYLPICRNGHVDDRDGGGRKAPSASHEIHMEEDAGKLVHDPWLDETMVDYNRCGVPLTGNRLRAGHALGGGSDRLPDQAAPDAAIPRRFGLQDAGGLSARGCEPLRPPGRPARNSARAPR